ncbi:hypothetical protein COV82_02540 [Candidatus Peregrinibacteria bacterium CG11_big_fil_rev_8_21_14_0_20_46_8]|nr:MAG: hypothetical protein COV82_02540 [Candidatus Peregrinibacteria bacterium CG11_big_fil_rev_8_21_14_0_20_46_8]
MTKKKMILLTLCVAGMTGCASSGSSLVKPSPLGRGWYEGRSGCAVQIKVHKPISGVRIYWDGACKDGKMTGRGTYRLLNSKNQVLIECKGNMGARPEDGETACSYPIFGYETYHGQMRNGIPHGKGLHVRKGGIHPFHYDGYFRNGVRQGQGILHMSGKRYEGYFEIGELCINCTMRLNDGTEYSGSFTSGKPYGEGTMIRNGREVEGIWKKGEFVPKRHYSSQEGRRRGMDRPRPSQPRSSGGSYSGGGGGLLNNFIRGAMDAVIRSGAQGAKEAVESMSSGGEWTAEDEERYRRKQQCENQKKACYAGCEGLSKRWSPGNISSPYQRCRSKCFGISCN